MAQPAALRKRFPQLTLDPGMEGVWEPDSGVLMARRAVQAVVQASGVDYEIRAGSKNFKAGTVVYACGPWLPKLFPEILRGRIRPTRQEVFFFGTPPGHPADADVARLARRSVFDSRARWPRIQNRSRRSWTGVRSRNRRPRDHRSRPAPRAIRPAPAIPCPGQRAPHRIARLPIRKHIERRFSDRPSSGSQKRLARGRRVRTRLQARAFRRRIRRLADCGHSSGGATILAGIEKNCAPAQRLLVGDSTTRSPAQPVGPTILAAAAL